ncbi:MAG: transporter substrate-binding domain-containing protein [Desulfobacteraceae bacterium]|nr:transporter substrate-binding domain-containing protein [Desulfobacteraceae bacterium]
MERTRLFIAILAMVLLTFSAKGLQAEVIRIGTDKWPPHEDIFNLEAPGFCTEVVREVFKRMGVAITITEYPWSRAVDFVFKGRNDALFCALFSEERARFCHYPEEAIETLRYLLFIKKENAGTLKFDSYDDLKGKRIGVVRGFAYPMEFLNFIEAEKNAQAVENDHLNFRKLMMGRIDYTIADHANATLIIRELGLTGQVVPVSSNVIMESGLNLIFSKKTVTEAFVKKFSDALKAFKKEEAYEKIWEKYYGPFDPGAN